MSFYRLDLTGADLAPAKTSGPVSLAPDEPSAPPGSDFNNDESAARAYLEAALRKRGHGELFHLLSEGSPQVVPDMRVTEVREQPLTDTRQVNFRQYEKNIPVFGSIAVVDLTKDRSLLGVRSQLTEMPTISPIPSKSAADALQAIVAFAQDPKANVSEVHAPLLTWFQTADATWHLTYLFESVPAAPPDIRDSFDHPDHESGFHCARPPWGCPVDYLIDAHDGSVVYYYLSSPMLNDIPSPCTGSNEDGVNCTFYGYFDASGNAFVLRDPIRNLLTYDLGYADINGVSLPLATPPLQSPANSFANTAAVTAHSHAAHVYDFYNNLLKRDSIDDKGMLVRSVVNVRDGGSQTTPTWANAAWWNGHMWYGQNGTPGSLKSMARFLDVIGHELTHGVTQSTARLVYRDEPGALNESMSDIFGVLIRNWSPATGFLDRNSSAWQWEIGKGFRPNGKPLRHLNPSDPSVAPGPPDHYSRFVVTTSDNGGVHTNSNIHNKAAFLILTSKDAAGNYHFTPEECAVLYYLTLQRLSSLSKFSDTRHMLESVAAIYFRGQATLLTKTAAIAAAYDAVGIH